MNGYEFEHRCAALLKSKGYHRVSVTKGSGDQGIDVIAHKAGKKYGIQCKYYSSPVGNKAIQEAYSGARFYDCDRAVVMTNNTFTKAARELADKLEVELWDHCSPAKKTFLFQKLSSIFLMLFLLAGLLMLCSMQFFHYPEATLFHYIEVFSLIAASISGIAGWRFFLLNLLSGTLYLAVFLILLFSEPDRILPDTALLVFLLPALLTLGHALFLHIQKHIKKTTLAGRHQKRLRDRLGKAYTKTLSSSLHTTVRFVDSGKTADGYKFRFQADVLSSGELSALEKELNLSLKDHYRLQQINDSQFYLYRIEKQQDNL
nr:restriction endonuclease [uncultured Blautia sp.]